jgi:hypothetical protein
LCIKPRRFARGGWLSAGLIVCAQVLAQESARTDSGDAAPARVYMAGFSILLPADVDWQPVRREPFGITLAKPGKQKQSGFVVTAQLIGVPLETPSDKALLDYVKASREVSTDRSRFMLVASEERISDGRPERCVKYHTTVEDHAQAGNGAGPVYLLDVHGYSCVHPQDPNVGLDFSYAVRAPREENAEERADNAEGLLREIKFEAFKPAELSAFFYNSGITLRHQRQFPEAETMLKRALAAQEKISREDDQPTGRRMAELAAAYIAQGKLNEGVPLVERLVPLADGYSEDERRFLGSLFAAYAEEMRKAGHNEGAKRLEAKSKSLGTQERE